MATWVWPIAQQLADRLDAAARRRAAHRLEAEPFDQIG